MKTKVSLNTTCKILLNFNRNIFREHIEEWECNLDIQGWQKDGISQVEWHEGYHVIISGDGLSSEVGWQLEVRSGKQEAIGMEKCKK